MDLFTLYATIGLDTSEYEAKVGKAIEQAKELKRALGEETGGGSGETGFSQTAGTAASQTDSFGSTVKGILASDVIRRGADAMVDFGKKAVENASDLTEVQNVVDTTFGDMATQLNAWSKTTKDAFGLTELQSKQYASRLGSMMTSAKVPLEEAFEMATSLTGLSADLASFFNDDYDQSYQKIQSYLTGQVRPMRDYGIDGTVAHLQDFAHELGYDGAWKELDEADQYRVRYAFLMDRTRNAQGDYARTLEDSFANQSRLLENNMTELSARVGEAFLPLATAGARAANEFFGAIMSENAEDTLANIDAAAENTASSIEATSRQAEAMIGVLGDLGDRSALTGEEQARWDSVMGQLLRTIPELGALVDEQTGEIEGGTAALRENVAAWEASGKAAADTSALQAKRDMLADTSAAIAEEETQIAIAQKAVEDASGSVIALGAMVASELGQSFDGTTESARALMDTVAGSATLEKLGYKWADVSALIAPLNEAEASLSTHQEKLDALEEKYDTISADVDGATQGMSQSIADAQEEIGDSFGQIEDDTDSAVANFNQSAAAYANAHATGSAAARGLNDAYPAYDEAADKYARRAASLGDGAPSDGSTPDASTPAQTAASNADGLSYVPYNDYLSYLHKGEAVLTASQAEDWRAGRAGNAAPAAFDYDALARAVAQALDGAAVMMDGQAVGNLVTDTVSRNIAESARLKRGYVTRAYAT